MAFFLTVDFRTFLGKKNMSLKKNGLHGVTSVVGVLIPSYSALNAVITKQPARSILAYSLRASGVEV